MPFTYHNKVGRSEGTAVHVAEGMEASLELPRLLGIPTFLSLHWKELADNVYKSPLQNLGQ